MGNKPLNGILCSKSFTQQQKDTISTLYTRLDISKPMNETILSDMRSMLDLMRKEDDIFDEKALDNLQEIMKSSSQFSSYLVENFDKAWDKILSCYKSSYDKPKTELLRKVRDGEFDFPKDSINEEAADLKKLSIFWLREFRPVLLNDLKKKFSSCLLAESMHVNADFVLKVLPTFNPAKINENQEAWGALDRANKAISDIAPFSTICKISAIGTNNTGLNQFAGYSAELGGPKCRKITCLGSVGSKLRTERQAPSYDEVIKVMPILRFMPGNKSIVETFDMVALLVSVLELVEDISKSNPET